MVYFTDCKFASPFQGGANIFDMNFFFSLGCTMDTGKRYSVGDILMIYVLPPFIPFSYAPFLQLHFQIVGNIYPADFLKTNLFFAR